MSAAGAVVILRAYNEKQRREALRQLRNEKKILKQELKYKYRVTYKKRKSNIPLLKRRVEDWILDVDNPKERDKLVQKLRKDPSVFGIKQYKRKAKTIRREHKQWLNRLKRVV